MITLISKIGAFLVYDYEKFCYDYLLLSESSDENCIYINANVASIVSLAGIHQILAIPHS